MKTWKKIIIGLAILGAIALALYIAIDSSPSSNFLLPAESIEYHTKEELTDLYWQNSVVLNSVKDSVLSNEGFLQVLIDQKDGDAGILTDVHKDLFSVEEWRNIVSVFENLHPYMIMMERKGRHLKFYIDFPQLELETGYKYTSLYWFPDVEEIKYHKEVSYADSVEYTHLDGNWYIVEETYER
jgi:hypothetical protein